MDASRRRPVLLTISPRGEICIFATTLFAAIVIALVMSVVVNQLSRNSVQDIAAQRNDNLKTYLLYLEALNLTIVAAPTPNPLTQGVFVQRVPEILINRGPGSDHVPSSVDTFDAGAVNLTTTSFVNTGTGIFRVSGDEIIDCCAIAGAGCDVVWQSSDEPHSCCGNMVQMNASVACGMNFSPEQALRVSKLVPSAPSGEPGDTGGTGTLNIGHSAVVTEGRVSYDGGRQIPITYGEYIIALNTSRRWTMAEVAPCGMPLQGTSQFNPCVYGHVLYPVDVISVYQGVSNTCQRNKPYSSEKNGVYDTNMIKKTVMNIKAGTPCPEGPDSCSFTYDKPPTAIEAAQVSGSAFLSITPGVYDAWSMCQYGTSIVPNAWANTLSCPVDSNLKPQSGCEANFLSIVLAQCGSLRPPADETFNSEECQSTPGPIESGPSTDTAARIFDPEYTYVTTPSFELVDGAVYEVRFGGLAMNFRPSTATFNITGIDPDDGVCSTFNVRTIVNDACGTQGCDFYFPPPNPANCTPINSTVTVACSNNTAFPFLRIAYSSAPMSFQLYPMCLAIPDPSVSSSGAPIAGYNPVVFELIDGNSPFIYDYSLNPQTHQMDGVAFYRINLTKLQTWEQAGATPPGVTSWKGQCGMFMAATPMMPTSSQQFQFRTVGLANDNDYEFSEINECIYKDGVPQPNPYVAENSASQNNGCDPQRYHDGSYQFPCSGTGDTCARFDSFQPMGYNHFCQTTNLALLNTYMEVITALPGITEDLEPVPTPTCTPTPAPAPGGMRKRLVVVDDEEP